MKKKLVKQNGKPILLIAQFRFDLLSVQFDDKNYSVKKDKIKIRGVNNFSFIAKNESEDGNIILSVLDSDIQGILTKGHELYRLSTAKSGEYILTEIDQSNYPEEKCDNFSNDANHSNENSEKTSTQKQ